MSEEAGHIIVFKVFTRHFGLRIEEAPFQNVFRCTHIAALNTQAPRMDSI